MRPWGKKTEEHLKTFYENKLADGVGMIGVAEHLVTDENEEAGESNWSNIRRDFVKRSVSQFSRQICQLGNDLVLGLMEEKKKVFLVFVKASNVRQVIKVFSQVFLILFQKNVSVALPSSCSVETTIRESCKAALQDYEAHKWCLFVDGQEKFEKEVLELSKNDEIMVIEENSNQNDHELQGTDEEDEEVVAKKKIAGRPFRMVVVKGKNQSTTLKIEGFN